MPSFRKASFTFNYQTRVEIERLRNCRNTEPARRIPAKVNNRLLIATWNIANLGQPERRQKDYGRRLRPIDELPDDVAAAVASVEVVTRPRGENGGGEPQIEYVYKIRLWEKTKALVKLGEHLGLFDARTQDGTEGLAELIEQAQRRAQAHGVLHTQQTAVSCEQSKRP